MMTIANGCRQKMHLISWQFK